MQGGYRDGGIKNVRRQSDDGNCDEQFRAHAPKPNHRAGLGNSAWSAIVPLPLIILQIIRAGPVLAGGSVDDDHYTNVAACFR